MSRHLPPTDPVARAERALATGAPLSPGDLAYLLDRVAKLERLAATVAAKRRKGEHHDCIAELAAIVCPGLDARPAGRKLRHLCQEERTALPAAAEMILQKIEAHGGLPCDRQIANIIRDARTRNEQEI